MRFLLCLDRASRGDRYEDKILADIILFRHFGSTFIVVLHAYPRFNDADVGFSDTDIGSNYAEARFERKFLRENPEIKKDKTYRIVKTLGYVCGIILVVGVWPRH